MEIPGNFQDMVGVVAMEEFDAARPNYKEGLIEYAQHLVSRNDEDFLRAAIEAITFSVKAQSLPGDWAHVHFKLSACFYESRRRHMAAGHDGRCSAGSLYRTAYTEVSRKHGMTVYDDWSCDCPV